MHRRNLRSVDLNLLPILRALLEEQNVTRAANRVGLSQPALSHALERLRALFSDPILERIGQRLVLSRKAERLHGPLVEALRHLEGLLALPRQDLRKIEQTVSLCVADYGLALLLPAFWPRLQDCAPALTVAAVPWTNTKYTLDLLVRGDCDLAVSTFGPLPVDFRRLRLGREEYVGIARKGHPVTHAPTLEAFVAASHVVFSNEGSLRTLVDDALAAKKRQRHVVLAVPSFMAVPSIVASSELIALVPRGVLLAAGQGDGLATFDPPVPVHGFDIELVWHKRRDDDEAVRCVRDLLVAVANERYSPFPS
jgi:DNA-binding transcriptional LysR family regulator